MTFKEWLREFIDTGEPTRERPDLLATALPGIISTKDDPPKPTRTATKGYEVTTRRMRKHCRKA